MRKVIRLAAVLGLLSSVAQAGPVAVQALPAPVQGVGAAQGAPEADLRPASFRKKFTRRDVPDEPIDRNDPFEGNGIYLLVWHSLGLSQVAVLYDLHAGRLYSSKGKGEAIPLTVRINLPGPEKTWYSRKVFRLYETKRPYVFSGQLLDERNRAEVIAMAREVLENTHCMGGTVTENHSRGRFAKRYDGTTRSKMGGFIAPGWNIEFRCSRWHKN
ncbi:MAG: hypothetical protein R3D85_00565 [Paracoccaceae bacterium]